MARTGIFVRVIFDLKVVPPFFGPFSTRNINRCILRQSKTLELFKEEHKLQIMSYNSFLNAYQTSSLTPTSTSKTIHLTTIQNAATFVGTPVLNSNRILSPLGCLDVFIRSIRSPNHPIGTLYWPQIIVLAWICSSELQIHDLIWRKKNSFQLGSKAQIRYLSGGSDS